MKKQIEKIIYEFFINSNDFNGIPLRQVSRVLKLNYKLSIDLIKSLVVDDIVSIQSSTNPHIIGFQHYPIDIQVKILEDAKNHKVTYHKMGKIRLATESTEFPICLYPSVNYLKVNRDLTSFKNAEYIKQLALAEPQLKPIFFEIEVLERYFNDPRFDFDFNDYSGQISCKYDENNNPIVREEDQIFLKTFGLGFDSEGNRLAVVYLRYLKDLTSEHQIYWKSKEAKGECKMLKEYHENTIAGSWVFSQSIFSAFLSELNCLNELSKTIFGKNLFLKSFENNKQPKEFTFFFIPTTKNYYEFIGLLDKMISDNINKDFFNGHVELFELKQLSENMVERVQKGTLRLFEEWLLEQYKSKQQEIIKKIFKPFKDIRKERQKPAHRINENEYDKKYIEKQREIISQAYSSMRAFREIFQQHPKAQKFDISNWINEGEIKNF